MVLRFLHSSTCILGVQVASSWNPATLHEFLQEFTSDLQEFTWSPPGVYQESTRSSDGLYPISKFKYSTRSPERVQVNSTRSHSNENLLFWTTNTSAGG
jgi:hypothetical protein